MRFLFQVWSEVKGPEGRKSPSGSSGACIDIEVISNKYAKLRVPSCAC